MHLSDLVVRYLPGGRLRPAPRASIDESGYGQTLLLRAAFVAFRLPYPIPPTSPMKIILALAALQQTSPPQVEIARITVLPASRTMIAGDTLRLTAEARDAQGRVIPGVVFRYRLGSAARFEGRVDSLGLLTAGSTSTLPVTVTATLPGARPRFETLEMRVLPGPVARIAITPANARLITGQKLRATARVYSAASDRRGDSRVSGD